MSDAHLRCEARDGYAVLTLERPQQYNALSHALVEDLRAQFARLDADPRARAIVLTGAGKAFCAGADLSGGPSDAEDVVRRLYIPLIQQLTSMGTPVVAAINGVAAGAGLSIALATDIRIASESAGFALSFVKVGLVPDAGATWLLPRAIGSARAAELALTGRKITAHTALEWNLVNEVVAAESVLTRAEQVAAEIATLAASVGQTRKLLHASFEVDLSTQLDAEATAQGLAQHHPHYAEGRQAFRDKRTPRFH
ncbi:enoyl-CoA hydratase/isomerase family protein [Nocardia sp. R16R-3T]